MRAPTRLWLASAVGLALLPVTAPQRAQHGSAAAALQRSAVIVSCAVRYDTLDSTLSVFRSTADCRDAANASIWRHVIPVASPACGAAGGCASNGGDSSFRPPCVARSRTAGVSWRMSFFSGDCEQGAGSLVLQGRLDACDACEVDATGGGSSHRIAHAFHSLVASGIDGDAATVVHNGSYVHDAARRDAKELEEEDVWVERSAGALLALCFVIGALRTSGWLHVCAARCGCCCCSGSRSTAHTDREQYALGKLEESASDEGPWELDDIM